MATIANLTKKDGGFSGTLILPSLNGMKITFDLVKNTTDKGPDYRVTIGGFESRAARTKTSKQGNPYISVKLSREKSRPQPHEDERF